jgi:hypothetical protein
MNSLAKDIFKFEKQKMIKKFESYASNKHSDTIVEDMEARMKEDWKKGKITSEEYAILLSMME